MSEHFERFEGQGPRGRFLELEEERAAMRPPRVIVADDDDDVRVLAVAALRAEGCEVVEAKDGNELLQRMAEAEREGAGLDVDVIVSDMRMPGITGLEALFTLRQANSQAPMILMTAFGNADVCREAERLGVEVVLEKPFAVHDLVAAVLSRLSAKAWARSSRWAAHAADAFRVGSDRTPG